MRIEVLIDVKTRLGEGPLWDYEHGRLFWLDIPEGRIFSCNVQGAEVRAWHTGGKKIGSMALRQAHDGAIVALEDGLYTLDFASGDLTFLTNPEADLPHNRLNDGKVDRQGRFVFGSMDMREEIPSGVLYSFDGERLQVLERNIKVSNGPCWSPDGKIFYFADSWAGEIWAYDYDVVHGTALNRRAFAILDTHDRSAADGSTVDSEGCLWNAQCASGKLIRYTPDGDVERIIHMPVKNITSVMFGGDDLDVIYVTSMGEKPLPFFPSDNQLRGSVFAIYGLGIRGLPEPRFRA